MRRYATLIRTAERGSLAAAPASEPMRYETPDGLVMEQRGETLAHPTTGHEYTVISV